MSDEFKKPDSRCQCLRDRWSSVGLVPPLRETKHTGKAKLGPIQQDT